MISDSGRRRSPLLVAVLATAIGLPANANPPAEARARFQEGVSLFGSGRYAEARAEFEQAMLLVASPRVLANIAACYDQEGRPADALRMYRRFLEAAGPDVSRAARRAAEREVARLRPMVGWVVLAVEPAGASVAIDGDVVGVAPLMAPLPVGPGDRTLEVRATGYVVFTRTVTIATGRELDLAVVLEAVAPEPRTREPAPRAAIVTPAPGPILAPPVPRQRPEPIGPEPAALGRGPLLWTGVGLTAAAAIGATATGLLVLSARSEYEDPSTTRNRRLELLDSTPMLADVTSVLIDVAIAVALATLGLYAFAGPSEEPTE